MNQKNDPSYENLILQHYKKVAQNWGDGPMSSMQDQFIRQKEVEFILQEVGRFCQEVNPSPRILEVGCGNGYLLSLLNKNFPKAALFGREFSPELLSISLSRNLSGVDIEWGDCRLENFFPGPVDLLITERVVINILDRSHQEKALSNFSHLLRPKGRYIMVESFMEPLQLLNKAALEMCLNILEPSAHNLYLDENILQILPSLKMKEISSLMPFNSLSGHFFITRILHESLRPKEGKVKETEFVKFFDQVIPSAVGNYSPILFRLFEKG